MICNLCPRKCNIERSQKNGYCNSPESACISRAALHLWEEPCISGKNGSGAVFFSGCNLKCIFCQNSEISRGNRGICVSVEDLSSIMLDLQGQGAHNINLVTPSHYIHAIIPAIRMAKQNGLTIPIVYNSSGYDSPNSLRALEGLIDIYLPDIKYYDSVLSARFSSAPDYREVAFTALDEMLRQQPECLFDEDGIIKKGVIVRHLVLPGHTKDSKLILNHLASKYGTSLYISLMSQYTPMRTDLEYSELNRRLTRREYEKVVDHALSLGLTNGYIQESGAAVSDYIPAFDHESVTGYGTDDASLYS
ncbi:MAG: radical SAM protein [Lachnospiraceae bacterium]|nr:radical SAM protein [Lachnospiraceae bacterium]